MANERTERVAESVGRLENCAGKHSTEKWDLHAPHQPENGSDAMMIVVGSAVTGLKTGVMKRL